MKYKNLFAPIVLGNVFVRNRIASAPNSLQDLSPEGYLRPQDIAFYEIKARGGVGLVTLGESIIHTPTGKSHPNQIPLDDKKAIPSLYNCAKAIRRHGAVASLELSHGGKFANAANSVMEATGLSIYGPMEEVHEDGTVVHQMDDEMIMMLIEAYGQAAANAKAAGFNMIHIHGGHGWLINQFMSENTNQRDDRWGGSFEKRMRFADMVLERIRQEIGPNFPIELRMSGREYTPGGYEIEEAIKIAKHLENKINLLNVSAGNHEYMEAMLIMHQDMFKEQGYFTELAEAIKKEVRVPVSAVGGIWDPEFMEELIATGKADMVEIGRGLVADQFIPNELIQGKEDEIVKCCRCFACIGESAELHHQTTCALNPTVGREIETMTGIPQASDKKKVYIAGAGPAGLYTAIGAAIRGHDVTVFEKSDSVGGMLKYEKHLPFKKNLYEYPATIEKRARRLGVKFVFNCEVTPAMLKEDRPDVLVAAIGGEFIVPPIPGTDGKNVMPAAMIPEDRSGLGEKIVILGGGLVGAEAAIGLAQDGKQVTIVEMLDEIAKDANMLHKAAIGFKLRDLQVKVVTGMTGKRITEQGLVAEDKYGAETVFDADTVLYAVGIRPLWEKCNELRVCVDEFYQIGDCLCAARVKDATAGGYQTGLDI